MEKARRTFAAEDFLVELTQSFFHGAYGRQDAERVLKVEGSQRLQFPPNVGAVGRRAGRHLVGEEQPCAERFHGISISADRMQHKLHILSK